jgi:hypothetical protein
VVPAALLMESAGLGSCSHAKRAASLQTSPRKDTRVSSLRGPSHADAEAPKNTQETSLDTVLLVNLRPSQSPLLPSWSSRGVKEGPLPPT